MTVLDRPAAASPTRPNSVVARDQAYLLHPMSDLVRHAAEAPLVVERGVGVRIESDQGQKFIEGVAGLWSVTLGFSNKRLADVAYEQLKKLPSYHLFGQKAHQPSADLAEELIRISPMPAKKVFFANSGSEANDSAVKLVWYYNNALGRTRKKKIISRQGGYHGVTVAAGSLTGLARFHADFDLPIEGILHTDSPHYWRYSLPNESEADFSRRIARNLEDLILKEGPDTVAAFIAEPVMGSGGIIVPPENYFAEIERVLRKYDVLFIADEVITGFGRLGHMFGTQAFDLHPDLISLAKGLSSGYLPISALLISPAISEACLDQSRKLGLFGHGFTYSGHPVCSAVALEALRIYEEIDIVSHVRSVAPVLQDGLRALSDHPLVGEVRGLGLIAGLEIVKNKATKENFDPKARIPLLIEERCAAHGVLLRAIATTIAISPPLIIERGEIEEILRALRLGLDDAYEHCRAQNLL
jgi:4-aminobutyrate---pyruvate transaminase